MGTAYPSEGFNESIDRKRKTFIWEDVLHETRDVVNRRLGEVLGESFV
jgi:hypothetical protein